MPETVKNIRDSLNRWAGLIVLISTLVVAPLTAWMVSNQIENGKQIEKLAVNSQYMQQFIKEHKDEAKLIMTCVNKNENSCLANTKDISALRAQIVQLLAIGIRCQKY